MRTDRTRIRPERPNDDIQSTISNPVVSHYIQGGMKAYAVWL